MTTIVSIEINIPDNEDANLQWQYIKIIMSDESKNITLKIDNTHRCFEQFGMIIIDNYKKFIGSTYFSYDYNDEYDEYKTNDEYEEHCNLFTVEIQTSVGVLSISCYNTHNGYYSHDVSLETEDGSKLYRI